MDQGQHHSSKMRHQHPSTDGAAVSRFAPEHGRADLPATGVSGRVLRFLKRRHSRDSASDAFLNSLIFNMNEGFVLYDLELRYQLWNPYMERLTGMSKGEVVGKRALDLFPHIREHGIDRLLRRALQGESVESTSTPFRVPATGRSGWVVGRYAPHRNAAGEIVGVIGLIQDVTEERRAADDLRRALSEKEALLREVHHRVRNNMAVISSMLSLQADRGRKGVTAEMVTGIRDRIRAMSLVHDRLYRSGDLGRVDLAGYIDSLAAGLRRAYPETGERVRIRTEVRDVAVAIDQAVPCGLILNELISNALKHAFPAGREGEIVVAVDLVDDGVAELRVSDNGAAAGREALQTPGLGLDLVKILTQQLGGELAFEWGGGIEARVRFSTETT